MGALDAEFVSPCRSSGSSNNVIRAPYGPVCCCCCCCCCLRLLLLPPRMVCLMSLLNVEPQGSCWYPSGSLVFQLLSFRVPGVPVVLQGSWGSSCCLSGFLMCRLLSSRVLVVVDLQGSGFSCCCPPGVLMFLLVSSGGSDVSVGVLRGS